MKLQGQRSYSILDYTDFKKKKKKKKKELNNIAGKKMSTGIPRFPEEKLGF